LGAKSGEDAIAAVSPSMAASVVAVTAQDGGTFVVDVAVPASVSNQLATWVSTGRVVVVRDAVGDR
jgi:hypothetical protein